MTARHETGQRIQELIEGLAACKLASNATNQYCLDDPSNVIRRNNLRLYLESFTDKPLPLLLVSEAPGYAGMTRTGLPFSSEHTIINHPFYQGSKYQVANPGAIMKEQSATIVWKAIDQAELVPLMWPAFPFHPFKAGDQSTNRKPRAKEIEAGAVFLRSIIDIFQPAQVLAVGRVAERLLERLKISYNDSIRHPANGGATKFTEGFLAAARGFDGT